MINSVVGRNKISVIRQVRFFTEETDKGQIKRRNWNETETYDQI